MDKYYLILKFLASLGCVPDVEIKYVHNLETPGMYMDGVVYLRNEKVPSNVIVHELWHSCQTGGDYILREKQARKIELMWREYAD